MKESIIKIKERKFELERIIKNAILDFEKETLLQVTDIYVERIDTTTIESSTQSTFVNIRTTISL